MTDLTNFGSLFQRNVKGRKFFNDEAETVLFESGDDMVIGCKAASKVIYIGTTQGSGHSAAVVVQGPTAATRTAVTATPFSVLASHSLLGVTYTATAATTLNLPQISGLQTAQKFTIVDEGGNASTNNITVSAYAGDTIIGNSTYVISTDYSSITLYNNGGTGWFIM